MGAWARTVSVALTIEETRLLLQDALRPYRSHIQELLLVALLQTLARWMGTRQIRLDLEGHGREELGAETPDVSRTMGWFTSLYPVLFTLPQDGGIGIWIKTIKEQLRSVPHKGISYGLLRYLCDDTELREQLASAPPSQVVFNYLGQFAVGANVGGGSGEALGRQNPRNHIFDVNTLVIGGQLRLLWTYSERLHQQETVQALVQEFLRALRELLDHCLQPEAGSVTPSDFPLANLDQTTLERLLAVAPKGIEDIYPLTPLQQGLLFHTLSAPASGVYIEQVSCTLRSEVEVDTFEQAWLQVIRRHAILRTAFAWQGLSEPLQMVFKQVKLPLSILDWRGSPSQQQEADLEALLLADRVQGFDVGQAPLMRLTLVRLSEMRVQMIWTHHHLLLDGWSVSLVLQEVLACYEAEIQGESFVHEAPRPYRDYISWLTEQEDKAAEVYWRQTLAGIVAPTPLGVDRNVGKGRAQVVSNKSEPLNTSPVPIQEQKPGQSYAEEVLQVSEVITRKSQQYAREQRVTFNTLMQAAWALVLSRYSGQADVVFGITVSGRPPELAGVEQMIGLFINTVPVRVQLQGEEEMGVWLTRLQEQQLEQRSYEYSSLVQVQSWCRRHRSGAVGTRTGASPVPTAPVRVPTSPDGRSDPERIPHDQSLFESLLVFENYPVQAILAEQPSVSQSRRLGGLAFVEAVQVMEQTNYPLTIVVEPGVGRDKPQPLRLRVSYDRLRFERATIERMLGHLQTVLQQLVADPRKRLMEISLLTEAEHELVARGVVPRVAQGTRSIEWTNDPPPDLYVHQLFEQQVLHTPDAVALVFEEAALTYQELNDKANQLAHHLQAEGIGPDEPVGFYMERSPELVIAMLGILKAGGAYVPLDPSYPAERLTFILEETRPTLILTQAHLGSDLPSQWGYRDEVEGRQSPAGYTVCLVQYPTTDRRNEENLKPLSTVPGMGYSNRTFLGRLSGFALDTIWPDLTQEARTNPLNLVLPDSLAYIIYTSGSTGKPKGAMITHQGLSNYVNFSRQHYRRDSARLLSEGCSSIVHSSLGFDLTITSLFVPLTSGGSVILLPEGQGIEGLVALLRRHQYLSFLKITPAHLELLNQMLPSEELDKVAYTLIIGGEALAASRVANWWKFAPQTRLINEYGPTETVVGCSIYEVGTNDGNLWSDSTDSMDSLAQMVPIGYPIANTRLYILDAYGHPVPIGVVGELFIGGLGIARGYKNRPDLTAERFVPHPFVGGATGQAAVGVGAASFPCASPHPGERLYRSGDLARYLPDGTIEFLGRIDSQVKLRGYRIELGEIEATLHAHPVVQEAAVVLQEERTCSTEDRKYLVAYIVTRTGESFTTEAEPREAIIQAYLRERLPSYMVPTSIIELSSMPLTPNGKLDREALPAPKISTRHESFVAPHMPVEQTLAAIWRQVLGRELIGIHDNFFALGGDSILSMQIIRRAHLAGLYLTPKQLFQYQTIAQLATVAVPNAFPPDLLGFDVYTSPVVRRQESMAFLDPLEGTETKESTPTGPAEVFGPVPLTPIQHRFFEQEMPVPQHFNPAVMLQVPSNWNLRHLQQAVDTWLIHHDALRLRYERTVEGWQQRLVSVAEAGTVAVQRLDLTQVEASDLSSAIEQAANSLQASLDLTLGPLLRVVLFDLGDREPVLLLIVIHHLAVDGVSWRILLEGMQAVMARLSQEHPRDANSLQGSDTQIPTPVRTVSFQRWAEHLQELARSDLLLKERAYWLKTVQATNAPLPLDCGSQYQNTGAGIQEVSMTLTFEETRLLLQEAPRPYRCHIQELLLVALLQTLARWIGTETIRLDLYGHGREGLGDDVLDVSSTVGWFTSVYPVLFTLPRDSGGSQPSDRRETLPRWIKNIKEQLLTVPHKGIGYGLLRYLHADTELQAQLSSASPSQVSFNYLGQFDQVEWGISSREEVPQPVGPAQRLQSIGATHGPLNPRSYLLEINVLVLGGQLHLQWTYNKQLHHSTTIERLASEMGETLRELLVHCLGPEERDAHPGDLDLPPPIA